MGAGFEPVGRKVRILMSALLAYNIECIVGKCNSDLLYIYTCCTELYINIRKNF